MKCSMFKSYGIGAWSMVIVGALAATALLPATHVYAQQGPPQEAPDGPPRDGDGPPRDRPQRDRNGPEDRNGPPGERDGANERGSGDRGGPPRGGAGGGPGRGTDYDQMRGYMELVDRYAKMARDPSASGVAAVVASSDTLRRQGPKAAVEFFEKLLPDVKNETVARAIRIQLADLYRKAGQEDKALEQLRSLITSIPAGAEVPKQPE